MCHHLEKQSAVTALRKEEATEEEALKRRQKKQKRTQLSNPEEAVLQQSAPKVTVNQDQQNLIQTIYSTYYVPAIKYNDTCYRAATR